MSKVKKWLCSKGWHWIKITEILRGGDGPDYAIHRVKCSWCNKTGFRYYYNGTKTVEFTQKRKP